VRPDSKRGRLWMCTGALTTAIVFSVTGCGTGGQGIQDEGDATASAPSSSVSNTGKSGSTHVDLDLTDKVCHLNQPGVLIRVSGVSGSPAGPYYTEAQYRSSSEQEWSNYSLDKYDSVGTSAEANSMVNWHWSCTADNHSQVNDKPGEYRFRISWPYPSSAVAQTDWLSITVQ
jgi:hypothetical protein